MRDDTSDFTTQWLLRETAGLIERVRGMRSLATTLPVVSAARIPEAARRAVDCLLDRDRESLLRRLLAFQAVLSRRSAGEGPAGMQRRLTALRMRLNAMLTRFDLFSDAVVQRAEHETGIRLAGLDHVARAAIALPEGMPHSPPILCYLDRGAGGAIRRARTRLPGGVRMPIAIIRLPRERMLGSGVAATLVHEVGHQAADLLGLVPSVRRVIRTLGSGSREDPWTYLERWVSEILADLWAVARVGLTATLGLKEIVSVPRAFVFRATLEDPHPAPWIRVGISASIGNALYPHPVWSSLIAAWRRLYPIDGLSPGPQAIMRTLESRIPELVDLLLEHRSRSLLGMRLGDVIADPMVGPDRVAGVPFPSGPRSNRILVDRPLVAFARLGQARLSGEIDAGFEFQILESLLRSWALEASGSSAPCTT